MLLLFTLSIISAGILSGVVWRAGVQARTRRQGRITFHRIMTVLFVANLMLAIAIIAVFEVNHPQGAVPERIHLIHRMLAYPSFGLFLVGLIINGQWYPRIHPWLVIPGLALFYASLIPGFIMLKDLVMQFGWYTF